MSDYGACGICDYKFKQLCRGCYAEKGQQCEWYKCCKSKQLKSCGDCERYPCSDLYKALNDEDALQAIDNLTIIAKRIKI